MKIRAGREASKYRNWRTQAFEAGVSEKLYKVKDKQPDTETHRGPGTSCRKSPFVEKTEQRCQREEHKQHRHAIHEQVSIRRIGECGAGTPVVEIRRVARRGPEREFRNGVRLAVDGRRQHSENRHSEPAQNDRQCELLAFERSRSEFEHARRGQDHAP